MSRLIALTEKLTPVRVLGSVSALVCLCEAAEAISECIYAHIVDELTSYVSSHEGFNFVIGNQVPAIRARYVSSPVDAATH